MRQDGLGNSSNLDNDTITQDEIFTDVDLTSTGPHHEKGARAPDNNLTSEDLEYPGLQENDDFDTTQETCSDRLNEHNDDQQSSGESDTIVPEVLDDENDDVLVDNKSPRGGKYNLRPNPTPSGLSNLLSTKMVEAVPRTVGAFQASTTKGRLQM